MKPLYTIALVLTVIGALNWGLVGLFQFDLVATLFGGTDDALARVVYVLVGIAALIHLPALLASLRGEVDRQTGDVRRGTTAG
jgi:uncharacterized protein